MPFLDLHWYLPFLQGVGFGLLAMAFHEAAHIVAALVLGIKVKKIGMAWKGMYTVREPGPPKKNLLISLAGPLMNLALLVFWPWSQIFGMANVVCVVANILPVNGSDGARVRDCWRQMHGKDLPN
jgi:Zn-dependent protease